MQGEAGGCRVMSVCVGERGDPIALPADACPLPTAQRPAQGLPRPLGASLLRSLP